MSTKKGQKNKDSHFEKTAVKLVPEHSVKSSVDFIPERENIKKKKHKKKRSDSDDVGEYVDAPKPDVEVSEFNSDESVVKKVKKNKCKDKTLSTEILEASCNDTQSLKHNKKKKRKKSEETESNAIYSINNNSESAFGQACERNEGKISKKKKIKVDLDTNEEIQDMQSENQSSACVNYSAKGKKKHKKSKHRDSSLDESNHKMCTKLEMKEINNIQNEHHSTNTEVDGSEKERKKRKKHKNKDYSSFDETNNRIHKDNEIQESVTHLNHSSECKEITKHHKKRKKDQDFESSELVETNLKKGKNNSEHTSDISKKNIPEVNEHASGHVHIPRLEKATCSVTENQRERNLAASEETSLSICEEEKGKGHKKKKKHSKDKQSSSFDKAKDANLSAGSGDKNVKESISNQSDLSKTEISSTCSETIQGQWQGNLFESSERQNKFLRLLGGMKKSAGSIENVSEANSTKKKGLFGSLTSLVKTSSQQGGNAAMSVADAANLNQKLEEEYNRAMNFKLSGKVGSGFGFVPDPAEGKKFHIDVYKSKSIKFND